MTSSSTDAIELSILFFEKVKEFEKDGQGKIKTKGHYKFTVMTDIQELLAGDMSYNSLRNAIITYVKSKPPKLTETYTVSDILKALRLPYKKGIQKVIPDNLITSSKFYYHPELQLTPPPPTMTQLDSGEFHRVYEEFYLEIKEAFTLDDLVHYFYRRVGVLDMHTTLERDKGAFRHILKSNEIDFVLHLIDEAYTQAVDRGAALPREPFAIQDYTEQARLVYENRKNTCYEGGFDRVIPRNRA